MAPLMLGPKSIYPARVGRAMTQQTINLLAPNTSPSQWLGRQDKASPLSGTWKGPADAFKQMEVSVQVLPI